MPSLVCADASILIKLMTTEPDSDRADGLWEQWKNQGVEVVAPTLLLFELTSVLRNKVHRGLLTAEEGDIAFDMMEQLPISIRFPSGLHRRAWELATELNRPAAYDSHYLALAEIEGCYFWTADERLFNAVKGQLPWVKWLGDFQVSDTLPEHAPAPAGSQ